ncbi:MAG: hypothetical protein HC883_01425 [Bdellovibrionaceae bacterium]|nr:hypothetical protein [Pseudobdellovibrionaceae bacterium]
MQRTFWTIAACALLTACSSLPVKTALDRVQPGMLKFEVLETAGNPKRTYREHGQDHWIYVFFENDRELSREVVFESGKVESVTRARAKANWANELDGVSSSNADDGFKNIDGGSN